MTKSYDMLLTVDLGKIRTEQRRAIILAETGRAARKWLRRYSIRGVRYVGSPEILMGALDPLVIILPCAYRHRQYQAIRQVLKRCGSPTMIRVPE